MLFKIGVERQSCGTGKPLTLFGLLMIPMILYGCDLWANSTTEMQWKQIEKIQKRLITNKFKIKSAVPYAILLSETGADPIEAIAMVRVIRYLKKMNKQKRVDGLRQCLMTYSAKERRLGCGKIINGLVNGVFA